MANFENGVASYIFGEAIVRVAFPVDFKGNADISCYQCRFFRRNYQMCGLNGEICQYPNKFVGAYCPLKMIREEDK